MSLPTIVQNMLEVSRQMTSNLEKVATTYPGDFAQAYHDLTIINSWIEQLKVIEQNDFTKVLEEATWDLFSSIYLAANGMYRTSFMTLRSALELGLNFLYFYDHNLDYSLWKKDRYDMKWATLTDEDSGVLSKNYILFFCNPLGDKALELIRDVKSLYRDCSQYVHGKYEYMHTSDLTGIQFDQEKYIEWNQTFRKIVSVLITLYLIRFGNINLSEDVQYQLREYTSAYPEVFIK